jgi:hypothetical protein
MHSIACPPDLSIGNWYRTGLSPSGSEAGAALGIPDRSALRIWLAYWKCKYRGMRLYIFPETSMSRSDDTILYGSAVPPPPY